MKLFQPIQGSIESKETQENLIDRGQLQVNVTSCECISGKGSTDFHLLYRNSGKYMRTAGDGFFRSDRSG